MRLKYKVLFSGLFVLLFFVGLSIFKGTFFSSTCNIKHIHTTNKPLKTIKTIYGKFEVTDPVISELIDSPAVQRMKKVNQYDPFSPRSFSRYDHSIGVWALLKKFGASREEQIAGLLHDTSHTVFSHVGDKVFKCAEQKNSYQDNIHEWYLKQTSVKDILEKHNIPFSVVDHKCDSYKMLEQDLPDICMDRLEYNLRGGLVEGLITQEEVLEILDDVGFENGKYFFTNVDLAKKFSEIPLYLTEHVWGSHKSFVSHVFLAHALLRAVEINLITMKDILFSTDDIVLKKLKQSSDPIIKEDLYNAFNCNKLYNLQTNLVSVDPKQNFDRHFKCKFRGIDPLIKTKDGSFKRLSAISRTYSHYYNLLANKMKKGYYIKITDSNLQAKNSYLEEIFTV